MSKAKASASIINTKEAAKMTKQAGKKLSQAFMADLEDPWMNGNWSKREKTELLHYEGNTVIDGNFEVGPQGVIVSGDLDVSGCILVGEKADVTLLVVLGDMHAKSVCTLSQITVFGNVDVETLIYGNSLGDYAFAVGGDVKTRAIVPDGHNFHLSGNVEAEYITDWIIKKGGTVDRQNAEAEVIIPEVFKDDAIDIPTILEYMKKGTPVLISSGKKAKPAAKPSGGGKATKARHFEFKEGTSNKFWEILIAGQSVTTRWGKIGTEGQSKTKEFESAEEAQKEYERLIKSKTHEGYVETGASAARN